MASSERLPATTRETRQEAADRLIPKPLAKAISHGMWNSLVTTGINAEIREAGGSIKIALQRTWILQH